MKTPTTEMTADAALVVKNEAVLKAYNAIISEVKQLIPQFGTVYLRTFIEVDYTGIGINCLHGFYSPLIHLRLDNLDGITTIYFARSYGFKDQIGFHLDAILSRCVYRHTSKVNTEVDIEDVLDISLYKVDDYKQSKGLIDMGYKGAVKHVLEAAKLQA